MESADLQIRELRSPLRRDDLKPLEGPVVVVQFREPLSDNEYAAAAALVSDRPDVNVRAYGDYGRRFADLDFLRHFEGIRGLQIDLPNLANIDGIAAVLGGLERFSWGWTHKTFSAGFLADAGRLEDLHLEKHQKDIEVVSGLTGLRRLSLRSIRLNDLRMFATLRDLRKLEIRLGGLKDISAIRLLTKLQYLELWRVSALTDLEALADLSSLEFVKLEQLKHVSALPSLGALTKLRRVILEGMKAIGDLAPVADAANLEDLAIIDMPQLPTDCLAPFIGHPKLQRAVVGLGSVRRHQAALAILPGVADGGLPRFVFSSS